MSRARVAAVAATVALALAGCGSTVQIRSTGIAGQDGLGGTGTSGDLTSGTATGGTGTTGSTGLPVPSGTSGGTAGAGTSGATAPPSQGPTTVGGSTGSTSGGVARKDPIKIGVITQQQLDEAAKSIGLDGVTTGDTKAQVNAVIGWIRTHGGLGGHPVQVYEYAVNLSDGSNAAIQSNACTAMAQDYKVQFVVTVLAGLQTLTACLAKHGIGLLADNTNMGDATVKKYEAILGHPSELGPGRMMTTMVDELVRSGWLTAKSKIGLLSDDGPDWRAAVSGPLTAALQRHGLKAETTIYINPNSGDGGSSQSNSAVLRFRSAGVDRVIPAGYSPLYMMIAAESQGYRPQYAMVSSQGPGALLEGKAPAGQLKGAAGIGWAPFLDIGKGPKPPPVSSRETLCFDLMRKAGQAATSALVKGFQAQVCDMLLYLYDLAALRTDVPRDLLGLAPSLLGPRFVSPATYRVDVTHHSDGVAGYRPLAYLDSCDCFQYTGGLRSTS